MNIKQDFDGDEIDGDEIPKTANDMMRVCMEEIHDNLMVPMDDKLNSQQRALLMIVGVTLKIIAEKATLYETEAEGKSDLCNLDQHHRN